MVSLTLIMSGLNEAALEEDLEVIVCPKYSTLVCNEYPLRHPPNIFKKLH